ncbi:hypothetical protein SLS60_008910 [Paraconiothyrium brasiliense]|uniref:Myb-like domain-containing protein n=1 Tax=Paraconiothyrium brasiliense TaxID=300254 RepID=A0ABR3QYU4_9PLEO
MSDNENLNGTGKTKTGWTDKERLVYLIGAIESTGTNINYKNAPRPNNRTQIACERMVGRIKTAYKAELDALKAGHSFDSEATPKKKGPKPKADGESSTPKTPKRKAQGVARDGDGEDVGSPTKKSKNASNIKTKAEIKDELDDSMWVIE